MIFQRLRWEGARGVLSWRRQHPQCFRSPYEINLEEQKAWFAELNHSHNTMRFWQGNSEHTLLQSVFGLTHIEWENGRAQISLVVATPGEGHGRESLEYLFYQAFMVMRLNTIYAEVYNCNPNLGFWEKMGREYDASVGHLHATKFWRGQYYDSTIFTFPSFTEV